MKYTAVIYLPGHGSRALTLKAHTESLAWDEARAACSPSERVQEMIPTPDWSVAASYDYQPGGIYRNYQRTVKLPDRNHITMVATTLEKATALAYLVASLPKLVETLKDIQDHCDDPVGWGPARTILDDLKITLANLAGLL